MKKTVFTLLAVLCAVLCHAQNIKNGTRWWDGSLLYEATVRGGTIELDGSGRGGETRSFTLYRKQGKTDVYEFASDGIASGAFRATPDYYVQHIRMEGMNFLAVKNPQGEVVWTFVLTPDTFENCLASQQWAAEQPVSEMLGSFLMNAAYLGRFSKAELRLMRNEILARHGYRFQSKDLQAHFAKQDWYKPGNDNNAIKLSVIEQVNVYMIKSEEATPETQRIQDYGEGDEEASVDDDSWQVIQVFNELDFFNALGNNREIVIDTETELNLSKVLENEDNFTGENRAWIRPSEDVEGTGPMVISEEEFDGRQLVLKNFQNLIIRGTRQSSIVVDPRYAFVLTFTDCQGVSVRDLTAGHSDSDGYCTGGVLQFIGGSDNSVMGCDLYGCGTYGICTSGTESLLVTNTIIRNCTYGIMELVGSSGISFQRCDFFENKEFGLVEERGCVNVSFEDCRFYNNNANSLLFSIMDPITLRKCEIYHPTESLGERGKLRMPDGDTSFLDTADAPRLTIRPEVGAPKPLK